MAEFAGSSPAVGAKFFTYLERKKMTRERALELIPILQAFAGREKVEYWDTLQERWIHVEACRILDYICQGFLLRVKPKVEIIPFDYSDDLVGKVVCEKNIDNPTKKMIIFQDTYHVGLFNSGFISYRELLDKHIQHDGSPCGKEKITNN